MSCVRTGIALATAMFLVVSSPTPSKAALSPTEHSVAVTPPTTSLSNGSAITSTGGSASATAALDPSLHTAARAADAGSCTVSDTFSRTVSGGWGTSDSGYAWVAGEHNGNAYVDGTTGVIQGLPFDNGYDTYIYWPVPANGQPVDALIRGRAESNQERSWYVHFHSAGYVAGDLFSAGGVDQSQPWYIRIHSENGMEFARAWQDGQPEPAAWTYAWPDAGNQDPIGFSTSNTSSETTTLSIDQVSLSGPGVCPAAPVSCSNAFDPVVAPGSNGPEISPVDEEVQPDESRVYSITNGLEMGQYLNGSNGPIHVAFDLPYLGPTDSLGTPDSGNRFYGKNLDVAITAFDVDKCLGDPSSSEIDTVAINNDGNNGQWTLDGHDGQTVTTHLRVPSSRLHFARNRDDSGALHNSIDITVGAGASPPNRFGVRIDKITITLPKPAIDEHPIVLLHGLMGINGGASSPEMGDNEMNGLRDYFQGLGYHVINPNMTQNSSVEIDYADIKQTVWNFYQDNGYASLNLIGHSLGGLVGRYALGHSGRMVKGYWTDLRFNMLFTVGSPHDGIPIANDVCSIGGIAALFGWPCTKDAAIYELRPAWMEGTFNEVVAPYYGDFESHYGDVYFRQIVGYYNKGYCFLDLPFGKGNLYPHTQSDGCVSVNSQEYMYGDGALIGPEYDIGHEGETDPANVGSDLRCLLFEPSCPLESWPLVSSQPSGASLSPSSPSSAPSASSDDMQGSFATSVTVPAGGSVDVPLTFEGTARAVISVSAPDQSIGATFAGTSLTGGGSGSISADLSNPVDGPLHITNSGTTDQVVGVLVMVETARNLTITPSATHVSNGQTVSLDIVLTQAVAGDVVQADLEDPAGVHTPITLTQAGDGHWAGQVTPTVGGTNTVNAWTTGNGIRRAQALLFVTSGTVVLGQGFTEHLVDNANGLADQLVLTINVTVAKAGSYGVRAHLVDTTGKFVAVNSDAPVMLSTGAQTLDVTFSGAAIYASGTSGPYHLVDVMVVSNPETTDQVLEASASDMGTTQPYDIKAFQHQRVVLDPSGFAAQGVDRGTDGYFDSLEVTGHVTVDEAGAYVVNASLFATDGTEVGQSKVNVNLAAGQNPFSVILDGETIWESGKDGPYTVENVSVALVSDTTVFGTIGSALATSAYTALQFTPDPSSQVLLGPADGFYSKYQRGPIWVPFSASYPGGAGLVEIWERFKVIGAPEFTDWTQVATASASPAKGVPLTQGDGTYEFRSIAVDALGQREQAPPVADATAVLDSAMTWPPDSHVEPLSSPYRYTTVHPTVDATMPYDVYMRFEPTGTSTFGSWAMAGSGTPVTTLLLNLAQGDGRYEFYSIQSDPASGATEDRPDVADAWLTLDTTAPTSYAGTLAPRVTAATVSLPLIANDGQGSGVKDVCVLDRYRPNQDQPWGPWSNINYPARCWDHTSSSIDVPLSGEGFYEFVTFATDQAGNQEAPPAVADAFTHYTTQTNPSSEVLALPPFTNRTTISIPYRADFASGGGSVDLYEHFQPKAGGAFTPWTKVATASSPNALTAALSLGEGRYEFYAIATDGQSGVSEAAPANADTSTALDTTKPTSSITLPGQYIGDPDFYFDVASSDDASGLAEITASYRFRPVGGESFGPWKLLADSASGYNLVCYLNGLEDCRVIATAADGDGTYEFSSVVTDGAGNAESGPDPAKASLVLDTVAPTVSVTPLAPAVKSTSVSIAYVASDPNGSGVASVDLYRRFQEIGSPTWADWTRVKSATASPISTYLPGTDGRYEFAVLPCDHAYTCRVLPEDGDTFTVLDRVAPISATVPLTSPTTASTVDVPYTASDPSGSGVAKVDLYRRFTAPGGNPGSYSKIATISSSAESGTFTAVALANDGTYEFYTRATDAATNVEAAPSSADATIVRSTAPASSVSSSISLFQKASPLQVPWVVTSSGSGIASVELWRRYTAPGATPSGSFSKVATNTGSATSGTFSVTASSDGTYEFYTIAVPTSGSRETAPAAADASVVLDKVAPSSTASATGPTKGSSVDVAYTAADNTNGSGLASVELWQRYTVPGGTPSGSYTKIATLTSSASSGTFTGVALTNDGRYEFYTIAVDRAANRRAAPSAADASVLRDTTAPSSSATAPATTSAMSVSVTYTINDGGGSGPASIELWQRYTVLGGTPAGGYSKVATIAGTATSGTFSNVATAADGRYEFYTIAVDTLGNSETPPVSADATTVRDTRIPATNAGPIAAAVSLTSLPVPYTVTAGTVSSVKLYQRWTTSGGTPSGSYTLLTTITSSATSGTFSVTLSKGAGRYEFYTLGVSQGGVTEAAPSAADAFTILDTTAPTSAAGTLTTPRSSTAVSVTYTASDNTNGSGLASVELWQRFEAAGSSTWSIWALATTATSSPISVTLSAGDGRYEFYTRAIDAAGNHEAAPSAADAFTILDTTGPVTSANALAAGVKSTSLSVPYTATDAGSSVASVELYQRYTAPGATPSGSYTKVATGSTSPFSVTLSSGAGRYEFYTLGVDALGNREVAPASADAFTVLDTTAPTSSAGPLPASVTSTALSVSYTATDNTNGSGLSKAELYQRFEAAGSTSWSSWAKVGSPGTAGSGTIAVILSSGSGTYQFYTIATDVAGNAEAAPSAADAFTILDTTAPTSAAGTLTTPRSSTAVSVTYTASDNTNGSGLASVELWQRFEAAGSSTWSIWALATTATSSPISVTLSAGDGRYEFYTRAIDAAGNHEAAPSAADAFTILDTTGPVTSANALAAGVKSTSLSVPYTATDAGSSVASVELYQRYTAPGATPSGSYTKVATGSTSPFSVTLSSGAGRYEFYTLGVDALGNREVAPASADAFTVLDTTAPTSSAGPLPASVTSTALSVSYTATDNTNGSGLSKAELYQRYTVPGGTPSGAYTKLSATPSAGSFSITLGSGSGTYEFYTIATDAATNAEAAPASADASTVYTAPDTTAPTSSITAPPSTSSAESIAVAYTASDNSGGSGLASVECWYRYKAADGATPGAWTTCGTSTTASGSFTLTFGSGAGIYDVLTVAVDVAGNREGGVANPPVAGAAPKSSVRSVAWVASDKVNTDTGTALQDNVVFVVGSDGTLYAVWEDSRNGNTDIYFSSRIPTTGVWAAETKLNTDTGTTGQRTPSIAIDGSGNLYVVWADDRNGATNTDIYFAKRTGTTWSANIKVNGDTATAIQSNPRISVSSAGIAVAVWYDGRSSQTNIYSARLAAGSTTWSTNYNITTSNTSAVKATPDVAVATDGTAWATWQDNRTGGGDIYVASLGPTATAWSTNTKVSDDSGASALDKSPRIGLTSANLPVLAWLDGRTTNAQVRVANRTSGGTWNASVQVSDASAKPATGLALAVKADGGIIVAWDDTQATSAIWGAQCESGSGTSSVTRCAPAEKWSDQTGASSHPAIVVSPTKVYLGWRDDTAGGGDIRIRLRNPS
jgi:Putative serine esterase (DUF676)